MRKKYMYVTFPLPQDVGPILESNSDALHAACTKSTCPALHVSHRQMIVITLKSSLA